VGRPIPFSGTFREKQAGSSSTEREIIGYVAGLAVAAQAFLQKLTDSSVLVLGDNQGGISALNHMRSSVLMICSALKEALELTAAFRFDIAARWVPREENQAADALSREPDTSNWG
jgi:ribonuclease HI